MMWEYVSLLILLLFGSDRIPGVHSQSTTIHQVSNCTKNQLVLTCPATTLTQVKDIVYGQALQCAFDPGRCYSLDRSFHPCTGLQTCRFKVPRVTLPKCGYNSYMTLTYQCIPVSSIQNICAAQELLRVPEGYLATPGYPTSLALPPSLKCTVSISQPRGSFVKIYLLDYGKVKVKVTEQGCESQVTFGEEDNPLFHQKQGLLPQVSLCLDSDLTRNQLLYKSLTNSVKVTFTGPLRNGRGYTDKVGILLYFRASNPDKPSQEVTIEPTKTTVTMAPKLSSSIASWTQAESPIATTLPKPAVNFFFQPITNIPEESFLPPMEESSHPLSADSTTMTTVPSVETNTQKPWLQGFFITNDSDVEPFSDTNLFEPRGNVISLQDVLNNNTSVQTSTNSTLADVEASGNKWASIVGGVMFGLAMVLLGVIVTILYTDRRRTHHRQQKSAQDSDSASTSPDSSNIMMCFNRASCISDDSTTDDHTENSEEQDGGSTTYRNYGYHQEPLEECGMPSNTKMDREIDTIDMDDTQTIICEDSFLESPPKERKGKEVPSVSPKTNNTHHGDPKSTDNSNKFETTVTIHNGDVTIFGSMEYLPPITEHTRSKFKNQLERNTIYEEPCVAILPSSESDGELPQKVPSKQNTSLDSSDSYTQSSHNGSVVYETVERDRNGRLTKVKSVRNQNTVMRPMQPPPPKPRSQKPPLKPKPRLSSSTTSLNKSMNSINTLDLDSNGYVACKGTKAIKTNGCHGNHCYSNHKLPNRRLKDITVVDNGMFHGTPVFR